MAGWARQSQDWPVRRLVRQPRSSCHPRLASWVAGLKLVPTDIKMNTSTITICNTSIRQDLEGRFCLGDLYKAAGSLQKNRPKYWLENQETKALIAELSTGENPPTEQNQAVKIGQGGNRQQGTFVVKELVYAYATWISPKFHIAVIRAYDALVTGQLIPSPARQHTLALEDDNHELRQEIIALKNEVLGLYRNRMPVNEITVNKVPVEAVVLMERYGVPREDIARLSGRSLNCIRQHVHNAKKQGGVK